MAEQLQRTDDLLCNLYLAVSSAKLNFGDTDAGPSLASIMTQLDVAQEELETLQRTFGTMRAGLKVDMRIKDDCESVTVNDIYRWTGTAPESNAPEPDVPTTTVYEDLLQIGHLTDAAERLADECTVLQETGAPPILHLLARANAELRELAGRVSD